MPEIELHWSYPSRFRPSVDTPAKPRIVENQSEIWNSPRFIVLGFFTNGPDTKLATFTPKYKT